MESPHASSRVILKANINQFCIVDCPGAVCNTCSVSAGMDARKRFPIQTSDNCEEAAPLSAITKLYHMRCTHAPPFPTLDLFKIALFTDKTALNIMLISFIPSRYTQTQLLYSGCISLTDVSELTEKFPCVLWTCKTKYHLGTKV